MAIVRCICGEEYDTAETVDATIEFAHYQHPLQGGWQIANGATFMVETMMERDRALEHLSPSS